MMNDGGSDRRATSSAILQFLQDTGTSPRQQYMLLQGARVHFHANGASEELVSLLNQAENAFKNNKIAYDVRADFAMLVHAKEAASTLGFEPSVLRDKYRELLLSGMNLGQLFYALSDLYKRLNFSSVIDLFLKAAGDDLAATSIETDRALLSNLLRELGVLKTMRSAYESCLGLIERVIRFTPSDSEDESLGKAKNLMGTLLSFCASNTASIEEGRKVFRSVEAKSTTPIARVVFGNGLLEQHRDLPDAVFPSDQARLHQIEILSEICSDLAEDEEHAYESANSLLTNERHAK
ncbi:type III secretion system YopN/LcrE/InvE/MxiC family regulator [Labrenzia sp. EL_142]|nr:type III secretion system YopN/LcrE/InvE/MxiC family regulator [Labrenzia sp. EL_142]